MGIVEYQKFDEWAKSCSWKRLGCYGDWTTDGECGGLNISYGTPNGDIKTISVRCTLGEAKACMTS